MLKRPEQIKKEMPLLGDSFQNFFYINEEEGNMSEKKFRFQKNYRIGAAAAEEDLDFLKSCYVNNGDLDILKDLTDIRQIIVGRTGTGKSALLLKLLEDKPDRCIKLSPENLALTYVANSNIIITFSQLGINLDPFFKLLWRHIFTVEVLKKYVEQTPTIKKDNFIDSILNAIKGKSSQIKKEEETLKYLKSWGEKFWLETEYRVKEITQKFEDELKDKVSASLKTHLGSGEISHHEISKLSEEQKIDVINKAQGVVSSAQVQDLARVTELLDSVLSDRQKHFYILVDGLDDNWVEDSLRYRLIMALLVTSREITRVKNVKIAIAMRRDLLDRVFKLCRKSGFQEEKYQSLYLTLNWSKDNIINILDKRINELIRRHYTREALHYTDVLPKTINRIDIETYLHTRANRPRDIIAFFNKCIEVAPHLAKLNNKVIKIAEGEYSRSRQRALGDEWESDYPSLLNFTPILHKRTKSFKISIIDDNEIADLCVKVLVNKSVPDGFLEEKAYQVLECQLSPSDFKLELFKVFYRIGICGLKINSFEIASWADEVGRSISYAEMNVNTSAVIHPAYYRALGINDK